MDFANPNTTPISTENKSNAMPRLLFWQYLVIFFVLGIIATRFFNLALCAGALLFFVLYVVYFPLHFTINHKKQVLPHNIEFLNQKTSNTTKLTSLYNFFLRLLLCTLFAILAFYYTPFISPKLENIEIQNKENVSQKDFALKNTKTQSFISEKEIFNAFNNPMQSMYIQGTIIDTQSLPYGRLRFFLKDTKPLTGYHFNEQDEKVNAPDIPQILSFTWDRAPYFFSRPVTGQHIIAKARIRETFGDIGDYWATKGVWYTASIYKEDDIFWTGQGNIFAIAREALRQAFVKNVFSKPKENITRNTTLEYSEYSNTQAKKHESQSYNLTQEKINNQAKAILPALLFGDRFYLSAFTMDTFNSANLLHSLALSGQHLALTTVLAGLCISFFISLRPNTLMKIPRRQLIFYATIPFALIYLFLGNTPFSLLRALAMFLVAGIFWIRAQYITLLDCLFFALALFCIAEPLSIFDLGVQLSFTSVFSIAFFMPILRIPISFFQTQEKAILREKHSIKKILQDKYTFKKKFNTKNLNHHNDIKEKIRHKVEKKSTFLLIRYTQLQLFLKHLLILAIRGFCTLFLVSFFIQISTFPLIVTYFGKVSYFFLLNIIWLPLLACIVLPFAAFALLATFFQIILTNYLLTIPFLVNSIHLLAQVCIEISSYPPKLLLRLLLYLQELGFDPYIQFYKPDKITFLAYYTFLFMCLYTFLSYFQKKKETIHTIKRIIYNKLWNKTNIALLICSVLLITCIPSIYNRFFQEKHLRLTIFDVGQGQSVLIENSFNNDTHSSTENLNTTKDTLLLSSKKLCQSIQKNNLEDKQEDSQKKEYTPTLKGRILIDAGGSSSPRFNVGRDIIAHKLTQNANPSLTYVIASHDDADHINGLADILQYFSVPAFAEPYVKQNSVSDTRKKLNNVLEKRKIPIEKLGMGDILDIGNGFALQILHPPYPLKESRPIYLDISANNANNLLANNTSNHTHSQRSLAKPFNTYSSNNSSLVIRLVKDGKGLAIICGDVEKDVLTELVKCEKHNMWTYNPLSQHSLEKYPYQDSFNTLNWSLQADVLILAHHGSINSYLPEFYELVNAHSVVASAGKYNRYGFPAQEIINYFEQEYPCSITHKSHNLQKNKINFLITAQEGDITFKWQDNTFVLEE